jgi:hypothetical protein
MAKLGRADILCGTCAKGIGTISEAKVQEVARLTPWRGQSTPALMATVADKAAIRCHDCEAAAGQTIQPK